MFHILITDPISQTGRDLLDTLPDVTYEINTTLSDGSLKNKISGVDGLIVRRQTEVTAEVIEAADKLKVIGRGGISLQNIDVPAATRKGILVLNTPNANSISAAEHTLGLILAAARHIPQAYEATREGHWDATPFLGRQIHSLTLGIIGFGRIGQLVAERALAFGMTVIAFDPYVSELTARDHGIELYDLDDMLAASDIVTLHPTLTDETVGLIGAEEIGKMPAGSILINMAHGPMVDEASLLEAIDRGHLSAAAVDVLTTQPPDPDHPLIVHPKIITTPHLGAHTAAAEAAVSESIVMQVVNALRGVEIKHAVNITMPEQVDYLKLKPYIDLAEKIGRLQTILAPHPIEKIEVEVSGNELSDMVRPIASGLLKGLLKDKLPHINEINAPSLARSENLQLSQEYDLRTIDYPNLITCRAHWRDENNGKGSRMLSGVLFGGRDPRIVQVDAYQLEANPEGIVLILSNRDVPGVIGQVATLLATYNVNIAEWRLGRTERGGEALSFINLDGVPPDSLIVALDQAPAVTAVKLVHL